MAVQLSIIGTFNPAELEKAQEALEQLKRKGEEASASVTGSLAGVGDNLSNLGAKLNRNVTLPLLAVGGVAVAQFDGLQGSLREVVTLTGETGAAGDAAFETFRAGVAELSAELGVAQSTLTDGLYSALSAGVPQDNAFEFLRIASEAAIGGVTDTGTAVDGITTTINAFGLDMDSAQSVADSFFTAVRGGKTTFEELSRSISNVAPAAAAAGVSYQEVNAALSTLTASGIDTSVASTQLRSALTGLQRPSEEMNEIFSALGFASAQVAIESEGLGFALDAVKRASGGNNGELQRLLGSTEAVAAANVLAGTSAGKFAADLAAQTESAGAAAAAFSEVDKSRDIERARVAFANLGIEVGTILIPVASALARMLNTVTSAFGKMGDRTKTAIVVFGGFLAALGPLLSLAGALLKLPGRVVALAKQVALAAARLAALGRAALANVKAFALWAKALIVQAAQATAAFVKSIALQIKSWVLLGAKSLIAAGKVALAWLIALGPIALVIAAVVGLVVLIVKNWDTIVDVTQKVWAKFKAIIVAAWNAVSSAVVAGVSAVVGFVKALPGRILSAIGDLAKLLYAKGVDLLTGLLDGLKWYFRTVLSIYLAIGRKVLDAVGNVARVLYDKGKDLFAGLLDGLKWLWDNSVVAYLNFGRRVLDAVGSVKDILFDAGKQIIDGLLRGFKSAWTGASDWLAERAQAIKNLKGPIRADRVMLVDEGEAIIGGLLSGMEDGWGDVERFLESRAPKISGALSGFSADVSAAAVVVPPLSARQTSDPVVDAIESAVARLVAALADHESGGDTIIIPMSDPLAALNDRMILRSGALV